MAVLTQDALRGSGTARHLGPTPRGRRKFGCEHVCRTRTARNRCVKDARRSVTRPSSALPRNLCGLPILVFVLGVGNRDLSKCRHRIAPEATCLLHSPLKIPPSTPPHEAISSHSHRGPQRILHRPPQPHGPTLHTSLLFCGSLTPLFCGLYNTLPLGSSARAAPHRAPRKV